MQALIVSVVSLKHFKCPVNVSRDSVKKKIRFLHQFLDCLSFDPTYKYVSEIFLTSKLQ